MLPISLLALGLVPALLKRVAQVNDCSKAPRLVPFIIGGERVGQVSPDVLEALWEWPEVFVESYVSSSLRLTDELEAGTLEERSEAVNTVALALRERGLITKWRGETLALVSSFSAPPALLVERRLVPKLGGRGYGVAINGHTRSPEGEQMLWVATRAADKQTWPGMLDTMAAGAMSAGDSVAEAARSEASEEAGVPASLLSSLKACGAVSYRGVDEDPVLPKDDVFFVFDLELPWDFVPTAVDGEVQSFERIGLAEAARRVAYGQAPGFPCLASCEGEQAGCNAFKPNINLVVIDFLVRHGEISPEESGYLELVASLRQGTCC